MEEKNMTCIVCPVGCKLTIKLEGKKVLSVTGNTCRRGADYAVAEMTNPVRTLTSTVRLDPPAVISGDGKLRLMPVRTDRPIPKASLFEAMKLIRSVSVKPPVVAGDVIARDFIEAGTNLIACRDAKA